MAASVYPQSYPFKTKKVREIIELLQNLDPDAPVVFQSPSFGAFGSEQYYSIDDAQAVHLPRRTLHHISQEVFDDETGDKYLTEDYTQVWEEWKGVVVT